MFDYKKTETQYVRHYEGEHFMMTIRDILQAIAKPVYVIRGNHDKEEILSGLEQTVKNFHYIRNGIKNFDGSSVCFMDSSYETGGYSPETIQKMESFLESAATKGKQKDALILICHETFAPCDNAVPDTVVQILKKNFDLALNGHLHLWSAKTYNSDKIICLPSMLPSKIIKGKYSAEEYRWTGKNSTLMQMEHDLPFGYVTVDTTLLKAELHDFIPSKKIVEVILDVTGSSLEDAHQGLKRVLSAIDQRNDKKDLIILPVVEGERTFSPLYLEHVKDEFPDLYVDNIRYEDSTLKSAFGTQAISAPTLSIGQLLENMKKKNRSRS